MNRRSKEFKELQDHWYKKLKDSGFEDIEDTSSEKEFLKVWHSSVFQIDTSMKFQSKEAYFNKASQSSTQYENCSLFFQDPMEQSAWNLHSQGYSLRDIAKKLNQSGYKTNKDFVHKIVNQFKKLFGLCG